MTDNDLSLGGCFGWIFVNFLAGMIIVAAAVGCLVLAGVGVDNRNGGLLRGLEELILVGINLIIPYNVRSKKVAIIGYISLRVGILAAYRLLD